MEFIFSDYVALLAAVLFVAAIVLFVVLLKNIFQRKSELETEEEIGEEPSTVEEKNSEISILEAHLESVSKDISEIKRKIDKLEIPKSEDNSEIKAQLQKINLKLNTIYNVLSGLSKE